MRAFRSKHGIELIGAFHTTGKAFQPQLPNGSDQRGKDRAKRSTFAQPPHAVWSNPYAIELHASQLDQSMSSPE